MNLLEQAKNKYKSNKSNSNINYKQPFNEFILNCYLHTNPASYGKYIEKKLIYDLNMAHIGIEEVSSKDDCGDFKLVPRLNPLNYYEKEYDVILNISHIPKLSKNFEIKVSYLGKTEGYTIRNIRPYQDINGGYIICLIDCENDFKEEFYIISYKTMNEIFNLIHMNGVSFHHEESVFQNMGASFKKDSFSHEQLKKYSLIDGDTFDSIVDYFRSLENELLNEFKNTNEFKLLLQNEIDKVVEVRHNQFMVGRDDKEYQECLEKINNNEDYFNIVELVINKIKDNHPRFNSWDLNLGGEVRFLFNSTLGCRKVIYDFCDDYVKEFKVISSSYYRVAA